MVVSPFVGVPSQSDGSKMSDISSTLFENRFFQNQLIRQGTSLAGPALIALGSRMKASGDAPRTSFRHTRQPQRHGKKSVMKSTYRGRVYDKGLKSNMFGHKSPMGPEYGYRTDYKSKQIKKGPGKAKTGKAISRVGRGAGVIGLGLVAYNIHRHGAKETAKQEGKFWAHDVPLAGLGGIDYLDDQLTGGFVSRMNRRSQITATVLLTKAVSAVF